MTRQLDLTVSLDDVEPRTWRRFRIDAEATFAELHLAIQAACGWEDSHLYEFTHPRGWAIAGLPHVDDGRDQPLPDASTVRLSAFFDAETTCRYLYDFGDSWEHTVRLEGVVAAEEPSHRRLLDGARAFPPEDCGGVPGYEHCVAIATGGPLPPWLEDPDERQHLTEWLGDWDPERFDLDAARAAFDLDAAPADPSAPGGFLDPALVVLPPGAVPSASEQVALAAEAEQSALLERLRRFTTWAGEGRTLTATGNLQRAAGPELIALLGTDDRFDERIGDRVFKTKSTVELREVDLTFQLARRAGFVKVRKGVVSATRRGAQLGRDPIGDWHAALDGLLALGVLSHRYAHSTWFVPYWKELVDEQVPALLPHLLTAPAPVAVTALHDRLWRLVERSFVLDDLTAEQLARHRDELLRDLCHVLTRLEELRAVHPVGGDASGRCEGAVGLTALGEAAARRLVGAARHAG
jgi:hypothetical protein